MSQRNNRHPLPRPVLLVRVLAAAFLAAGLGIAQADNDISKVNGSVTVGSGQTQGNVSTVNGAISLDDGATAAAVETVNGGVSLANGARAASVEAVNGAIRLGENAMVDGDVEGVNGAITLLPGARIAGKLGNVNGTISLDGAHVGGLLSSSNGSMLIGSGSVVEGGLLMRKPKGRISNDRPPRVVIGPGAQVNGTLVFERDVHLYVHDSARIGTVTGATVMRFSGETPAGE